MLVPGHLVVEILAPSIENAGLNLVALNHVRKVHVLMSKCQGLESGNIPLLQSDFLSIDSHFVTNHTESF